MGVGECIRPESHNEQAYANAVTIVQAGIGSMGFGDCIPQSS